jgi:UDP-glucose 4-epimerase
MTQPSKSTRIFVTGGAGFIGSHLVEKLVAENYLVTVYDNLVSGNLQNISSVIGKSNFVFINNDMLNQKALTEAAKGHDIIWHLGANVNIPKGNSITDLDLNNCTIATHNVLEAMRANKIGKIIFASSATVYGDAPPIPLSESNGPLLPISLYGAAKLACEGMISAYSHLFGIQSWIFRFGNVLGGRMNHGVIFDFIHKLKDNADELEILGDGNQEKNYFLVEDCIDGMFWAFQKTNRQYDVFNLGNESSVNVTNIARIVIEETGLKKVKLQYTGGVRGWPGDAPFVFYNIDKMKRLGWQAKYTSAEAVRIATKRLIEEYQKV